MQVGDIVDGTVSQSAHWGICFQVNSGEIGLINLHELSWATNVTNTRVPLVGESVCAKVIKTFDSPQARGHVFIGSIRELHPEENPWGAAMAYDAGQIHEATVVVVGDGFMIVELETKAEAAIEGSGISFERGQAVKIRIQSVNVEERIILAELLEQGL